MTQTVTVRLHWHDASEHYVDATPSETPGLVVHRVSDDSRSRWQITHQPSGKYVESGYPTRKAALFVCEQLAKFGIDYSLPEAELHTAYAGSDALAGAKAFLHRTKYLDTTRQVEDAARAYWQQFYAEGATL